MYETYLEHHGILGQKWGIRRYQNEDGSLTQAGKDKYYRSKAAGHIGRALTNTSLGQRLIGVGANKGYKKDKKEIKGLYKIEKNKIENSSEDKKEKKNALKSLKNDYKITKGEARIDAANAIYPWQSKSLNEKIQTQNLGKQFMKSFLLGDYGSLKYDYFRDYEFGKTASLMSGTIMSFIDANFGGAVSIADYAIGANSYTEKGIRRKNRSRQDVNKYFNETGGLSGIRR